MSDQYEIGATIPLRPAVVVDRSGSAITGSSTLTVEIERDADGYFWDWNDSTFKASGWTTKAGALAEVSAANAPGWYKRTSGWASSGQSAGWYWITYRDTAAAAANMPQAEEVRLGGWAGTIATNLDVVLSTGIQARLPSSLVSGRMDASVGAMAANVVTASAISSNAITAAKIATDAIGAAQLAADAVAEIQTGLATPTNITAGTITTVTNLTNAPTAGDLTATMKASVTTAATAATPTVTVGSLGTDAVSAAAVSAAAVTKIQTGLATRADACKSVEIASTATEPVRFLWLADGVPSVASFAFMDVTRRSVLGGVNEVDIYDWEDQTFKALVDAISPVVTLDQVVGRAGDYVFNWDVAQITNARPSGDQYRVTFYSDVGGTVPLGTAEIRVGTVDTLDALPATLASAHGAGSWATATGFATAADVAASTAAIEAYGQAHWVTADISTLATAASLAAVAVDAAKARRALWNRRTLSSAGLFTLYADDAATPLATASITDKDGGAITLQTGEAARSTALV